MDFPDETESKMIQLVSRAEEAEALERNRSHRQKINREAMEDISTALFAHLGQTITDTEALAKVIVAAIAKGQIRNVSITY